MKKRKMFNINPILTIIFLIWFFASITAMVYLSKVNTYYCMMTFGQFFLVLGIIFLVQKKSGIPFVLIGLACVILPCLIMNPEKNVGVINFEDIIFFLLFSGIPIAGIYFVAKSIIKGKKWLRLCTEEVEATIVKYELIWDNRTERKTRSSYYPIYTFEFNGKKYTAEGKSSKNTRLNPIGSIVKLKINPENPKEFLDKNYLIGTFILGIGFLFPIIIILILFLQNKL